MHSSPVKVESRREFFRAAGRYGLLGLMALAAGLAGRRGLAAGQRCINRGICRGCELFPGCGLPPALSAKRNGIGG